MAPTGPDPASTQLPPAPQPLSPEKDIEENKDIAALGYVWILSIVVYFSKKNSPFVRFHAKQGMVLFVLSFLAWIVPFGIGKFLELLVLAAAVLGFLAAAQGQWKEVPLVGPLARGDWAGVRQSWRALVKSVGVAWAGFRKTVKTETGARADAHAPPAPVVTPPPPASAPSAPPTP